MKFHVHRVIPGLWEVVLDQAGFTYRGTFHDGETALGVVRRSLERGVFYGLRSAGWRYLEGTVEVALR